MTRRFVYHFGGKQEVANVHAAVASLQSLSAPSGGGVQSTLCVTTGRQAAPGSPLWLNPTPHCACPLTPCTPQWFVYRQLGTTSVVDVVTLVSQTGAPTSLTDSPPGGIASALKLVTQASADRAFAGFFYPPSGTLSQTTSPPSPPGMFGGVSEHAAKGVDRVGAPNRSEGPPSATAETFRPRLGHRLCLALCSPSASRPSWLMPCPFLLHRCYSRPLQPMPGMSCMRFHTPDARCCFASLTYPAQPTAVTPCHFTQWRSTRLQYDWYRIAASGSDAPTLRLQLFSPTVNAANPGTAPNIVNVIWVSHGGSNDVGHPWGFLCAHAVGSVSWH